MELQTLANNNNVVEDHKKTEELVEQKGEAQPRYSPIVKGIGHVYRLENKEWIDLTQEAIPIFIFYDNQQKEDQYKMLAYAGTQPVLPMTSLSANWKFACASQKFISLNTGERTFGFGFNHPKDAKAFAMQLAAVYSVMQGNEAVEEKLKERLADVAVSKIQAALVNQECFDRTAINLLAGYRDHFKQGLMAQEQQRHMRESKQGYPGEQINVFNNQNKGFEQSGIYREHVPPNLMLSQRRHSYSDIPHQNIGSGGGAMNIQSPRSFTQMDTIHESQQGIGRSRLQSLPTKGQFEYGPGLLARRDLARPPYAVSTISDLAQASLSSPAVVTSGDAVPDLQRQQLHIMNAIQQGYGMQELFSSPSPSIQSTINNGRSKSSLGTTTTGSRYNFSPSLSSDVFASNQPTDSHASRFKYSQGLGSPYSPSLSSEASSNPYLSAQMRHLNNMEHIGSPASPSLSSEALLSPFSPVPQHKFDEDHISSFDRLSMNTQSIGAHQVPKRPSLDELMTAFEPLGIDNSSFGHPMKKNNH
ncbi:unnamed protein product, partial [Mesorhabditis belari]|uniref:WH1 domain-containing protein n=1 Tax=Mesorhabditis belari TaxID=2138241 RepID=A0AAF3EEI5_9BILA